MKGKAVVIMGSEKDLDFCKEIGKCLKKFDVGYVFRVASAHKTPLKVLEVLKEFNSEPVVFVTVAGRSNALSAFVDASTTKPVIACPPYSEKYGGADVYSSLRVPSGIGCLVTIEAEAAAIATAKIFALEDEELEKKIQKYQLSKRDEIEKANEAIKNMK
ncbi:MAG: AIR carboxylase family protein [Crenarchaeota archaeon]|nr:AIR carboxylase family protein [Thermoproteota archaeon]